MERRRLWVSDLEPLGAVGRLLGNVSWLREGGGLLRSPFARPRFPASGTIADTMVGDHRQQRINQHPATGGAASILGAKAVTACLAPLKLTWRGSRSFSCAATAITVRSKLYASR